MKLKLVFIALAINIILLATNNNIIQSPGFFEFQAAYAQATASPIAASPNPAQDNSESAIGILETINKEAKLPSFTTGIHQSAASQRGARQITSAIYYLLDLVKYIIGGLAAIYLVIIGISIVLTGKDVEEVYTKNKTSLSYILIGLVVIILADVAVKKVFFGETGDVLKDITTAKQYALMGASEVKKIYSAASYLAGGIAIMMIVIYGVKMLSQSNNEEEVKKDKKAVMYSAVGLAVIGISELLVKGILFKDTGTKIGYGEAQALIVGITNFLASFIGILSFLMFIFAGVMYLANFGNEELTNKAKSIIKGAVIGILLALAAFAFSTTIISFSS